MSSKNVLPIMIWHMTMRQWDEDNGKYFKGVYR